MPWRCVISIIVLPVLLSALVAAQGSAKKSQAKDAAIVQDFEGRVNEYLSHRQQTAGMLPGPTDSTSKLNETREQIRTRAQSQRTNAKQGAFFTPEIARYFRKQITSTLKGTQGAKVMASLRRAEPVKRGQFGVNQPYPDGLPRQSMPPTLLLKLPRLPKELEYRIVGRSLVLIDVEPNLVVDILPDVIPKS